MQVVTQFKVTMPFQYARGNSFVMHSGERALREQLLATWLFKGVIVFDFLAWIKFVYTDGLTHAVLYNAVNTFVCEGLFDLKKR